MEQAAPSVRSFESIEKVDDFCRELDWPLEYRQLQPGSFSSTFTEIEGDDWFLMEEHNLLTVEVSASAVADKYMLAVVEGTPVKVNGQMLDSGHVFLQSPKSDFLATLPADTRITQTGISAELFERAAESIAR